MFSDYLRLKGKPKRYLEYKYRIRVSFVKVSDASKDIDDGRSAVCCREGIYRILVITGYH